MVAAVGKSDQEYEPAVPLAFKNFPSLLVPLAGTCLFPSPLSCAMVYVPVEVVAVLLPPVIGEVVFIVIEVTPDDLTYPAFTNVFAVIKLSEPVTAVAVVLFKIVRLVKFLLASVTTAVETVALDKFIFVLNIVSVTRRLPVIKLSLSYAT